MESHQAAERASRLCLSGPHKDDLAVIINGREARQYASQGQTRTAALAMKLAEREIYHNATGEYPVLLLDDVLSELDPRRQEFVLNRIAGGQVFITCCEDDRLPASCWAARCCMSTVGNGEQVMNTDRQRDGSRHSACFHRGAAARRITCCEDDRLPQLLGGKVLHVHGGELV